jgi:hypothetical protein
MNYKGVIEDLVTKGITLATYWCGSRHRETDIIEYVDLNKYFYSGIISGDKAVFVVNGFGERVRDDET